MNRILTSMALAGGLVISPSLLAANIDNIEAFVQGQFANFSEDLGAALSYKALAPAEPLGITGFDVGVEVTATRLQHTELYDIATSGNGISTLPVPKLHLHKGLPFGIDVGLSYASVPTTDIKLVGAELRYAFMEGGVALPALAVRGTYSQLSGIDELDFSTKGIELTVSKGFLMATPYAGVGQVWVTSTPQGIAADVGLQEEEITLTKLLVGLNFNLGLVNLAVEGDKTGAATTYGLKFGFRW